MKAKAVFVDYTPSHARARGADLDPAEDARLFEEPEPFDDGPARLEELRRQIADVHAATAHGLATLGLLLKLRPVVCAILAASSGQTAFKASYKVLVGLLFRQGDGRTFNAKKCEVRKLLKALHGWQEQTKITLCTIRPGGRSKGGKGGDQYHDTEFELVFLDALARAITRHPGPEQMRAAVRVEIAAMMKLPPFDARWQVKPPSLEQVKDRDEKSCVTHALKACAAEEILHGEPIAYAERLAAKIVAAAREKFARTPPQEGAPASPTVENAEVEAGRGVSDQTHPPAPETDPPAPESTPEKKAYRVSKTDTPPPFEHTPEDHAAFESVARCVRGSQPFNVSEVELCVGSESVEELEAEAVRDEAGGSVLLE